MAERRMFTKKITESDAFLDMPFSSQALYFHMCMNCDDDGFLNNPRTLMRTCGAKEDDFKLLLAKNFIIHFESGIIVIKHWRMHNYIQSDRYKPTDYTEEKAMLSVKENKSYTLVSKMYTECIQDVSVGKDSIDKNSIDKVKHKNGEYGNVLLTDEEHKKLVDSFGETTADNLINYLDEAIEEKGYKYKSHYLTIAKKGSWVQREVLGKDTTKGLSHGTDYNAMVMEEFLGDMK